METPVTYTASPSSTSAGDLLGQIQTIIDERDAYRAKCERQDRIIEKLSDLISELQVYAVDNMLAGLDALVEAEKAPEPTPAKEFHPDDETVAQWAAEYDAGTPCAEIAKRYGVSRFRISGHISQYRRRQKEAAEPEPEPENPPESSDDNGEPDTDALGISDDTVGAWVRLMDDLHRTAEWIADQHDVTPYYVRSRVRQWREEHGETLEAA